MEEERRDDSEPLSSQRFGQAVFAQTHQRPSPPTFSSQQQQKFRPQQVGSNVGSGLAHFGNAVTQDVSLSVMASPNQVTNTGLSAAPVQQQKNPFMTGADESEPDAMQSALEKLLAGEDEETPAKKRKTGQRSTATNSTGRSSAGSSGSKSARQPRRRRKKKKSEQKINTTPTTSNGDEALPLPSMATATAVAVGSTPLPSETKNTSTSFYQGGEPSMDLVTWKQHVNGGATPVPLYTVPLFAQPGAQAPPVSYDVVAFPVRPMQQRQQALDLHPLILPQQKQTYDMGLLETPKAGPTPPLFVSENEQHELSLSDLQRSPPSQPHRVETQNASGRMGDSEPELFQDEYQFSFTPRSIDEELRFYNNDIASPKPYQEKKKVKVKKDKPSPKPRKPKHTNPPPSTRVKKGNGVNAPAPSNKSKRKKSSGPPNTSDGGNPPAKNTQVGKPTKGKSKKRTRRPLQSIKVPETKGATQKQPLTIRHPVTGAAQSPTPAPRPPVTGATLSPRPPSRPTARVNQSSGSAPNPTPAPRAPVQTVSTTSAGAKAVRFRLPNDGQNPPHLSQPSRQGTPNQHDDEEVPSQGPFSQALQAPSRDQRLQMAAATFRPPGASSSLLAGSSPGESQIFDQHYDCEVGTSPPLCASPSVKFPLTASLLVSVWVNMLLMFIVGCLTVFVLVVLMENAGR